MNFDFAITKRIAIGFSAILLNINYNPLKINSKRTNFMEFIREFWIFLRVRKKLWLAPIIIVMIIFGGLLIIAQGSVVAPFIYTLF